MLKQLSIKNLILVETMDISFDKGLNIITGETGAGKSAVMSALKLVIGGRADAGIIRKGCDRAIVEALFNIDTLPKVIDALTAAGIDHDEGEYLIIRREISATGKSKAHINNQLTQIASLKNIGTHLIEIVGQHANQRLFNIEEHRAILDLFADLDDDLKSFQANWKEEAEIEKRLKSMIEGEAKRLREIDICRAVLEELEEAAIKDGEEEALFAEYSLLVNSDELAQKSVQLCGILYENDGSIVQNLNNSTSLFESLLAIDPSLKEQFEAFKSAALELKEIAYSLNRYADDLESNPFRLQEVDSRLALINKIKRKYGTTAAEILEYQSKTAQRLDEHENADFEIKNLETRLADVMVKTAQKADILTKKRKKAATYFSEALTEQLRELNMPKVIFEATVTNQPRNLWGDDKVEYCIAPNVGENLIPVKECASGGEISRLLLALQTLIASKNCVPTLIFDEVDANIGGETATIVGAKLKDIGASHQVMCITHFPQVAKHADYHLQIQKIESEGRTKSFAKALDADDCENELRRMMGMPAELATKGAKEIVTV